LSVRSLFKIGWNDWSDGQEPEVIGPAARHWAVECYVPINSGDLREFLLARHRSAMPTVAVAASRFDRSGSDRSAQGRSASGAPDHSLDEVFTRFADLLHHHYRPLFYQFAHRYSRLDPDRDTRPIDWISAINCFSTPTSSTPTSWSHPDERQTLEDVRRIADAGRTVLVDAGYTELPREVLEDAIGQCSHWGVPLDVDLDLFDAISVYARGDVVGRRAKRRWQTYYKRVVYDVPLYQRVVVMFKLRPGSCADELDDRMLHLRMFKNIPKNDIDMLLPGTRVRFSWVDYLRNFVPSLGGMGLTLVKLLRLLLFLAAITVSIAIAFVWLCVAMLSYAGRSLRNHWHAKNLHMLNLTRSLYHQKLDSNAGVACRLLKEAESQRYREILLAYCLLLEAESPLSIDQLASRVRRYVKEWIDVEVAFRAQEAVQLLDAWGIVRRDEDLRLSVAAPDEALRQLSAHWQASFEAD